MSSTNLLNIAPLQRVGGLRTQVTRQIMQGIFTRSLKAGDRLVINKVAAQLGASATPVREALVELYSLGLVELIPDRGALCLPFGVEQLREIYHLRWVLEAEATRLAAPRLPRARLESFHAAFESLRNADSQAPGWSEAAVRADVDLHDFITTHSGSRRLCHEIERYREIMVSLREVAGNQRHVQETAVGEHVLIVESLLAGDPTGAAEAMADHLRSTAERVVGLLFPETEGKT